MSDCADFPTLSRFTPEQRAQHKQARHDAQAARRAASPEGIADAAQLDTRERYKGAHGIAARATGHAIIRVETPGGGFTSETVLRSPDARRPTIYSRDTPYGVERFDVANAYPLDQRANTG